MTLFTKVNDTLLQILDNELILVMQGDKTISQYFKKVKIFYCEIIKLDPMSNITKKHMKRMIIYGLRIDYRNFIATIQGWPT